MPKLPRLTASEAEKLLLTAGFVWLRISGSHRIDFRAGQRFVIPFHRGKIVHPKIVREVLEATGEA